MFDGRLHLARLLVDPSRRGQGIIRHLIAGLVEQGRRRYSDVLRDENVSLFVFESNSGALRAYQKLGFRPSHIDPKIQQPHLLGCVFLVSDGWSMAE